ncbi:hypothetical protein CRG98_047369 [Punica granatum]|uniref:Uncharacterized protein n=1 Tax=Punica granatum TaxID=22663 RepID=A0A2I0HL92_PUNGR|nr:hypothetical protein CRG98_047369 [Punica granatum]
MGLTLLSHSSLPAKLDYVIETMVHLINRYPPNLSSSNLLVVSDEYSFPFKSGGPISMEANRFPSGLYMLPGKAKIAEAGIEFTVEHDITGLEVEVEDLLAILVVKVVEGQCDIG